MSSSNRDAAALHDMVQAIREIQQFSEGFSEGDFLATLWLQRAIERDIEILGEACRRVSKEFQALHPEVDWRNTVAMRNIIAHRYEQVDYEILWDVVQTVLPNLRHVLEGFLAELQQGT